MPSNLDGVFMTQLMERYPMVTKELAVTILEHTNAYGVRPDEAKINFLSGKYNFSWLFMWGATPEGYAYWERAVGFGAGVPVDPIVYE